MAHLLPRGGQPSRAHDHGKIVNGSRKVLIHNNIIEFAAVPHLLARGFEPADDDFRRVLPTLFEAFLERGETRTAFAFRSTRVG